MAPTRRPRSISQADYLNKASSAERRRSEDPIRRPSRTRRSRATMAAAHLQGLRQPCPALRAGRQSGDRSAGAHTGTDTAARCRSAVPSWRSPRPAGPAAASRRHRQSVRRSRRANQRRHSTLAARKCRRCRHHSGGHGRRGRQSRQPWRPVRAQPPAPQGTTVVAGTPQPPRRLRRRRRIHSPRLSKPGTRYSLILGNGCQNSGARQYVPPRHRRQREFTPRRADPGGGK